MKYLNLACRVAMLVVFVPVLTMETICEPISDWFSDFGRSCWRFRIKIEDFADRKFPVHEDE